MSNMYKILSNILLSSLTPYAEEIWGYRQDGFRCNISNANHIFCIRQILEGKNEYNETNNQLQESLRFSYKGGFV